MKGEKNMLYIIYKICSDDGVPLEAPHLYAVTDDKKIYKEFERQRNMNIFKVTKKDFDKDDEESFYKSHSSYYLKDYSYRDTKDTSYKIVSTLQEYSRVVHSETEVAYEISRSFKRKFFNILSPDMKKAMKNTMYEDVTAYVDFVDKYYMSSDRMMSEDKPRFDISCFRIFIYLYGSTLNIKG